MPARPLSSADSVLRLTPKALAASVTVMPRDSRHSSRMISPGWGGLRILIRHLSDSPHIVNVNRILAAESKRDAPIAANAHRPSTAATALQRVELEPW